MDRVDLDLAWTRQSGVDQEQRDEKASADLLQHLIRYPEDLLDIRRLQRSFGVPSQRVAQVLWKVSPRH